VAVLQAALDAVIRANLPESGHAPAAIAVIGMGRLGGRELGYGSDADVLFVCEPAEGVQDSAAVKWAITVAEQIRALLGTPSADPPLEVDANLRPEGRSGPLVRTLASYAAYYGKWSKVWEAQALLRADAVVGDAAWPWYDLDAVPEGPFDLLLVDGPPASVGPEARYPAVPLLLDRLAKDALVVLDDTRRPDERAIGERWAAEFEGFALESLGHDHGTLVLRRGSDTAL